MVIIINSNDDMPRSLDTSRKQISRAKHIASERFGLPAKSTRQPSEPGFFSRTVIVKLKDDREVVVQFRPETLDLKPFIVAKSVLGALVPDIEEILVEALAKDRIWTYLMTCVPGKCADDLSNDRRAEARVKYCRSLGNVFSKAQLAEDSSDAVEQYIRPHMQLLLDSEDATVVQFREEVLRLHKRLNDIKKLPLFVAHYDLNELNFLIDPATFEVTGLIDWELSRPLPLGMGFERIHVLAGEYSRGIFRQLSEFEEAERGFWNTLCAGLLPETKAFFDKDPLLIQDALKLGTILGCFMQENGELIKPNQVACRALPVHLTYQLPMIRGSKQPYTHENTERFS
ncbi:MAG: hypothetical protein GOMPHAMPRED_002174 [Gomphillus americanus]|uniref:Aminoglycoside phosphotransferase domain-containing protein n=1 Tax=Gomphillus americanus TaxID=1940652 RepID=A0A8H3FA84_9LECA|nr:MAG: hypothetical protein GOMPHAMPRED_002174 [Gomphillus americanus]